MDIAKIVKAARQQGWDVDQTKKGHWRFVPPDPTKSQVIHSGTSGDVRSIHHTLANLRQRDFIWPWPPAKGRRKK